MLGADRPHDLSALPLHAARRAAVVLAALAVLLGGGCRADVGLGIDVGRDGSGILTLSATLDRAASAAVGDLRRQIHTADLTRAGWAVVDLRADRATLRRRFATPEEAAALLGQLTSSAGPIVIRRFEQQSGYLRVRTVLEGKIHLGGGVEAFGDPGIAALTGTRSGLDDIDRARVNEAVRFTVSADLPGSPPRSWTARMGQNVAVAHQATATNWRGISAVAVLLASGSLLALWARTNLRRRRRVPGPVTPHL